MVAPLISFCFGGQRRTVEEQQASITQLDASMSQLRSIATSNSAAAEEITATMVQLSQLAEDTRVRIAQFKTA